MQAFSILASAGAGTPLIITEMFLLMIAIWFVLVTPMVCLYGYSVFFLFIFYAALCGAGWKNSVYYADEHTGMHN